MEKPLDVVVKTRVFDAVPFAQLQKDLAAHSHLHGRVYVIVPRNERDQLAGLIGKNCIVLTAEEVAATFEMHNVWLTGKRLFGAAPRCEHCSAISRDAVAGCRPARRAICDTDSTVSSGPG